VLVFDFGSSLLNLARYFFQLQHLGLIFSSMDSFIGLKKQHSFYVLDHMDA